jgi:hypothetical protein
LALLVEAGTFRKIIVSFLPVGHTHEDIDQFFSRIAMFLRTRDAHSRLELARIISHLHASSSEWGKVRLVKHWENVANISGWLEDKVHEMPSITQWHQFRFMKNPTSGAVMLMAREWPGERGDYWSGFTKSDVSQRIWTTDDVPNLLAEYDSVPPAQSPLKPASLENISKTQKGVESLLEHLHATQEAKTDTLRLLEVFSTPAPDFNFSWEKDTICSLLGNADRDLVVGANAALHVDASVWQVTKDCKITENCFYLMQPPQGSVEPFWICKARKRIVDQDRAQVRVQWWEPLSELSKPCTERDYYRCTYAPAASNPASMPISQLPLCSIDEGFTVEINVKLTASSSQFKIAGGRNDAQILAIKWYVARWDPNSGMQCTPDELVPAALIPEGRIDNPIPPAKKPRRKAIPKATAAPKRKRASTTAAATPKATAAPKRASKSKSTLSADETSD